MDVQSAILGNNSIEAIAAQLGIPAETARSGAQALLPAILGGFKQNAQQQPGGLGGLLDGLRQLGAAGLPDQVVAPGPTDPTPGNQVLGSIFGSREVSRTVAAQAGAQSGIDPNVLKRMLPLLAMMAAGYLATRGRGEVAEAAPSAGPAASGGNEGGIGGMLGGLIGGLVGGGSGQQAGGQSGLGSIGAMLDLDGDGNPLNDLLNLGRGGTR